MALPKLRRRNTAFAVVLVERTARAQVEDADVCLGDTEEVRGLARRAPHHVTQQENGALPRREASSASRNA